MPLESVGNAQVIRKMIGNVPIIKEAMGSFVVYEKEMYNITASIVDGVEEGSSVIVEDCDSTVTIVPDVGYALPQSVVVVGASYTYDSTTGVIVLSNPTSNVTISATCDPIVVTYTITTIIDNGTYSGDVSITNTGTATVTITANLGYRMPTTPNITGAQYSINRIGLIGNFWKEDITLSNATDNVTIVVNCESLPQNTYNISYTVASQNTLTPQPSTIAWNEEIIYEGTTTFSIYDFYITNALSEKISETTYRVFNPTGDVTIESTGHTPCLLKDTDVLLANGTTKKIQDISYDDLVLTYNPYLKRFIGEYPCVITETPYEHITNNFKRVIFDDDNHLDIACLHTICVRENNEDNFIKISVWDSSDSLIGKDVVYYTNGETRTHKVIRIDTLNNNEKVSAYNVFVPMHGTIVTNNILTGGDFLISNASIENGYNKDFTYVNNLTQYLNDAYIIEDYKNIKNMCKDLPLNVFTSSFLQYYNLCNTHIKDITMPKEELDGLNYTLSTWKPYYKQFKDVCKVKIDETVCEVNFGDKFILPNTYNKYFDTTNYKVYNAGEQKSIYTNTVLIGIDNE